MTKRQEIDRALKTNNEVTAKIISYAKAQEKMIRDLFLTLETILDEIEEEEDDSA